MKTKIKIRRRCACGCDGITNPGRRYVRGHNKPTKGHKHTKETKLKMSLSRLKYDPSYEYCDAWNDREYKADLKKGYCEDIKCKREYRRLDNHHANLNKKSCYPFNIMTLCKNCHSSLHRKLESITGKKRKVNYRDFITIIRKDRVTYIHKGTREILTLKRRVEFSGNKISNTSHHIYT